MNSSCHSFFKTPLASAVVVLLGAAPLDATLAATCTWNPSTGNWATAGSWSCSIVPSGADGDTATIGAGKTVTVTTPQSIFVLNNSGSINVDSGSFTLTSGGSTANAGSINIGNVSAATLFVSNDINNAGGAINIASGSVLNQINGSILGGNVNGTGGSGILATSNGNNTLNGIALNGTLDASTTANSRERIGNGFSLNGNVNIANGGIVSLDSTIAASNSISGKGTFNLNDAGARLSVEGTGTTTLGSNIVVRGQGSIGTPLFAGGTNALINNGRISADTAGGTLTISAPGGSGSVTNNNLMDARNGGTLMLTTAIANSAGTINAQTGSTVVQGGLTITGGAIGVIGTGQFNVSSSGLNTLSGVSVSGTLDLSTLANARERVANGMTINGAINIANGGILSLDSADTTGGAQAIAGTATINLNDPSARLSVEGNGSTTLGSGITIRGQGNIGTALFSGGTNAFSTAGLVSADVSGGTLTITAPGDSGSFTTSGILQAINGATLSLNTDITSTASAKIIAGSGGTVFQNDVTLNGTIDASAGNFQVSNGGSNILNAVSLTGLLDLSTVANSRERIVNGITINGSVNIANGGILSLDDSATAGGAQTIGGNLTINLNDPGARLSVEGNGTTTLASTVTVRGQGDIGTALFFGGTNTLINNGLISADVSGTTLQLTSPGNSGTLVNNGTLQAVGGATLDLLTPITSNPGSKILVGDASVVLQDGITLSGVITASGSGTLRASNSGTNILSAVTLTGPLDLTTIVNSRERITNGITLNGSVNIAKGGILSLDDSATSGATQTIGGTAVINLNDSGARLSVEGTGTTILGSGVTVRGQGNIGTALFAGGVNTLINNGLISADVNGTALNLATPGNSGSLVNNGVLEARNGAEMLLSTSIDNTNGQINALTGSTLLQNDVTLTGGVITTTGTGHLIITANGANVLNGVTLNGVGDMTIDGNTRERIVNGLTLNGAINVANGGVLSLDSVNSSGNAVTVGGSGVINLNDANARLSIEGTGTTTLAPGLTVRGQGNIGSPLATGGVNTFTNNGTIIADGGTLTISPPANSGTLAGTGTLEANGGALHVTVGSAEQGRLVVGATGSSVALSPTGITLTSDYTNAQFGVGNSFNPRAGISGGAINAGGNSAQAVTGAAITGGTTPTVTLTIGNVRVGGTTVDYQIANTGTTGPTLRGAIQTSVNGANLTDSRLSGAGVTAGNYVVSGPGATSGDLAVTFTAASAGALGPLVNQSVNLQSNFGNIGSQKINIVLGSGAAAYVPAAGALQTAALNFGTVQVGQVVSQDLVIRNTASGPSGFVEDLNASFGASSGTGASLITGTGTLTGILAGQDSSGVNGRMTVGVDTSQIGSVDGGITINYVTAGAVAGFGNGLGAASVGSQSYGVSGTIQTSGTVINQASPLINTPTINLGARRVNDAPSVASVSVTNVSTGTPQAALNASITSNGAPVTASGSFTLLAPGATSGTQLSVGLSTATAGNFTGANAGHAIVALVSDASNVGNCAPNCQLSLASQQVTVQGKVYAPAAALVTTPVVNFGIVHVNQTVTPQTITVANVAPVAALNDVLTGSFGQASGPFTASGTLAGIAAGASNSSSFVAGLNTQNAGIFSGSGVASFASHNGDMADLVLAPMSVTLQGQVNNFAQVALGANSGSASLTHVGDDYTLNFGTITAGSGNRNDVFSVFNSAPALSDLLSGAFASAATPGFALAGFNSFALENGQSQGGFSVTLNGAAPGSFDDTIVLHSIGSNASGYSAALGDVTLSLEGRVSAVSAVPEPGTYVMLLAGLVGLIGVGRARSGRRGAPRDPSGALCS